MFESMSSTRCVQTDDCPVILTCKKEGEMTVIPVFQHKTAKKYYLIDSFCNALDVLKLIDCLETSETVPLPTTSPSSPSSSIRITNRSTSSEKERWFAKCFQEFPLRPHGCVSWPKEIGSKMNNIPHNILTCFLIRYRHVGS